MNLFEQVLAEPINVIPKDGIADYHGEIVSLTEADSYFNALLNEIEWKNDQAVIFGKCIETKRKVAWYADQSFQYRYSNTTKYSLPWTQTLLELKALVEAQSNESYNSCLLNLYHNGSEGMAWHSDGESELKRNAAIASLSFGAKRKFTFKHKRTKQVVSLFLQTGSLLVMKGTTQQYWLHRLPPTKMVTDARINLTFRTINSTTKDC